MIVYDGKMWRGHMRIEGSVIARASIWAIIPSMFAFFLKYADTEGFLFLSKGFLAEFKLIENAAAFTGFQFILGFVLVFRAGQCYSRFWSCALSACVMRSQLVEAASSLTAFTATSKAGPELVELFLHKLVRLCSLLHAVALQNIADQEDENYLVIDPGSIGEERLIELGDLNGDLRVDVVYQWITNLIVRSIETGVLSVPAPITSRVFQELEKSMIEYQMVLQTMSIPFPFPYAQVAVVLLMFYMLCAPFVMCYWVGGHPIFAALLTFISVACFVTIEMICSELEYPLGDDANDLPTHEWQIALNKSLLGLLHPLCRDTFELDNPILNLTELETDGMMQLCEFLEARPRRSQVREDVMHHVLSSDPTFLNEQILAGMMKVDSGGRTSSTGEDGAGMMRMTSQATDRDFKVPKRVAQNGKRKMRLSKREMGSCVSGAEGNGEGRSSVASVGAEQSHVVIGNGDANGDGKRGVIVAPCDVNFTDLPPEREDTNRAPNDPLMPISLTDGQHNFDKPQGPGEPKPGSPTHLV